MLGNRKRILVSLPKRRCGYGGYRTGSNVIPKTAQAGTCPIVTTKYSRKQKSGSLNKRFGSAAAALYIVRLAIRGREIVLRRELGMIVKAHNEELARMVWHGWPAFHQA
jgi:hypothetical protein